MGLICEKSVIWWDSWRAFSTLSPILWNSIPPELRLALTMPGFQKVLKKWLCHCVWWSSDGEEFLQWCCKLDTRMDFGYWQWLFLFYQCFIFYYILFLLDCYLGEIGGLKTSINNTEVCYNFISKPTCRKYNVGTSGTLCTAFQKGIWVNE